MQYIMPKNLCQELCEAFEAHTTRTGLQPTVIYIPAKKWQEFLMNIHKADPDARVYVNVAFVGEILHAKSIMEQVCVLSANPS